MMLAKTEEGCLLVVVWGKTLIPINFNSCGFFSFLAIVQKMDVKSTMLKIHPPHMHVLRKKVQDVSPFETQRPECNGPNHL